MIIDFNNTKEITIPGMNNGTGEMTAKMYMDSDGKIIPCRIHVGGSIGNHKHETSDDINYVILGEGKAICDDVLRYLKGSMENEPERTWNTDMHSLLQEMIHYVNGLESGEERAPAKILEYETRYDQILETAMKEYTDIPCSDYYRDGFNLATRMKEYREAHLLFLHNSQVPTTNNLAERLLRFIKRKQNQAVSFRSIESLDALCNCMSMLFLMRQKRDDNLYNQVSEVFG